jgi:hypothetical protein
MYPILRKAAISIIILVLAAAPLSFAADNGMNSYQGHASGYDYDNFDIQVHTAEMVADTVLARPLGLVSMVAGFGLFVISIPFSALGRNVGETWDYMVVRPTKFTFSRPLGQFN